MPSSIVIFSLNVLAVKPKEEEFVLNCSIEETWDDGEVSSTSGSFDYKATILPLEGGDFLLAKN